MQLNFQCFSDGPFRRVTVFYHQNPIADYCMEITKTPTSIGERLVFTTLTLWSLLDFCLSNRNVINNFFLDFEKEYIANTYYYCTRLYKENYGLSLATLLFNSENTLHIENFIQPGTNISMTQEYFLGYTGGKDSTLCKILLEETNKTVVLYHVSYDDDLTTGEGRIFCRIIDTELYKKYTITGYKSNSRLISFQQADDIHVTFIAPYIYPRKNYPSYLAVGLPFDAVHCFRSGVPDLVPTETLISCRLLEELMHQYGFKSYHIVSPIASLHTFGIYQLLAKRNGFNALLSLDSCWETTSINTTPCGMCPKCQRLKYIFHHVFAYDYLPDIPMLQIDNADFLFGSIHAMQLLKQYSPQIVANCQFIYSNTNIEEEFVEYIHNQYGMPPIIIENINFIPDRQIWEDVLQQIVEITGVDYRDFPDERLPNLGKRESKYLPFEKYYSWGRKYPVLMCCEPSSLLALRLNNLFQENSKQVYQSYSHFYDDYTDDVVQDLAIYAAYCNEGNVVMEVGCGTGRVLQYLLNHKHCTLIGVDISSEMLTIAKKKLESAIKEGCLILRQHNFRLHPINIECDVILITYFTMNYITDGIKTFLRNIYNSLRPRGVLVADLFIPDAITNSETNNLLRVFPPFISHNKEYKVYDKRYFDGTFECRHVTFENNNESVEMETIRRYYAPQELVSMLRSIGFHKITIQYGYQNKSAYGNGNYLITATKL